MPILGLCGPFALTLDSVDEHAPGAGPGVFALGRACRDGRAFVPQFIGRCDDDLHERLKVHAGAGLYPLFAHAFTATPAQAFLQECALYHDCGATNLDNVIHPMPPHGLALSCPMCGPETGLRGFLLRQTGPSTSTRPPRQQQH